MKFFFNPNYPNATNEQKWEQIRLWRNAELAATDWTQLNDSPVNKAEWATYRQMLRDLHVMDDLPDNLELPERPA